MPLFDVLAERALDPAVATTFCSQGIANTAWAFAKMKILNERLMAMLLERALEPEVLASFSEENVTNMLWAYNFLGIENNSILDALEPKDGAEGMVGGFE